MVSNQVTNEKPRDLAVAKPQGRYDKGNDNSTTLKDSKSRYEKGKELYKEGKVRVGSNGLFKVSSYYEADTEKMTCTCPDYKTSKEACKHLFASMLFVKIRGKSKIEHLDGHIISPDNNARAESESKQPADKLQEAHN